MKSEVVVAVVGMRKELEVVRAVVGRDLVTMMNDVAGRYGKARVEFVDHAVEVVRGSVPSQANVARVGNGTCVPTTMAVEGVCWTRF